MSTPSPTLIEFKETVRDAFGYLVRDFGFREVEAPAQGPESNPFLISFANTTTLVQVEGINWGFAAQVILGPAAAADTVPLWALIKHRRPELYAQLAGSSGQLADIRFYAHALREVAEDVLRGEFGVFAAASGIVDEEWKQQRLRDAEEALEQNRRTAVADAGVALRAKDFQRVVDLLTPHTEQLTAAERAKLDYARARSG